jgi:hypothetical protein
MMKIVGMLALAAAGFLLGFESLSDFFALLLAAFGGAMVVIGSNHD